MKLDTCSDICSHNAHKNIKYSLISKLKSWKRKYEKELKKKWYFWEKFCEILIFKYQIYNNVVFIYFFPGYFFGL